MTEPFGSSQGVSCLGARLSSYVHEQETYPRRNPNCFKSIFQEIRMKLDETVPSGTLERENDQKQEAASIFMKRLDEDRRIVGMQPAELWRILETKGVAELRAELDRRADEILTRH